MHIHDGLGMIPHSEFAVSAITLGVSAETVAIRFAEATARAWRSEPIRLSRREVAVVSDTADFGAAISALRSGGRSQSSAALERALWLAPGLEITALLERERDRRAGTRAATTWLAA